MIQRFIYLCLGIAVAAGTATAADTDRGIASTYTEHARGVALARQGKHAEALAVLEPLLARFPDDYPLARDVVLVSTWSGDCDRALKYFDRIRSHPRLDGYLIAPLADCAVQRARGGEYDRALDSLTALVPHATNDYMLRRDITLINAWKRDCKNALRWFDPIRDDERNPVYLIVPAVDCLLAENRPTEAQALVEAGRARHPADAALEHAYTKVQVALRLDANRDDERPAADASLLSGKSDRGVRESSIRTEASAHAAMHRRIYARYLMSRANPVEFEPGEMNRAGVGMRWWPTARWRLQQEFSADIHAPDLGGSHTSIEYRPYDAWTLALSHDTYAEDISVRARANDIQATRDEGAVEYNSRDYVWYGRAAAGRYDYSDGNRRTNWYTTLGYAYEMLPEREQRIYGEWYRSHNTLEGAAYFNPKQDNSVGLVHRTDFVYDSRFKRHVDHLFFTVSRYRQDGFGAHGKWGARYEQDYDFDSANALLVRLAFDRNVYDGQREDEWRLELLYRRRF